MTLDVSRCPAVILVFAMDGCGACEEYKPRLEQELNRWRQRGHPFVDCEASDAIFGAHEIPVILLDAQSPDAQIQSWADQFHVEGLPTTILFRRYMPPEKHEGSIGRGQIHELLLKATQA